MSGVAGHHGRGMRMGINQDKRYPQQARSPFGRGTGNTEHQAQAKMGGVERQPTSLPTFLITFMATGETQQNPELVIQH